MICQRCGNCCCTMGVAVMVDTPDGLKVGWKPDGKPCPHLSFDGAQAGCAVHQRPEYEGSPCWVYGNSEVDPDYACKRGKPCLVGKAILEHGGLPRCRPQVLIPTPIEEVEIFGTWRS